jgi:hypothetical protein
MRRSGVKQKKRQGQRVRTRVGVKVKRRTRRSNSVYRLLFSRLKIRNSMSPHTFLIKRQRKIDYLRQIPQLERPV